MALADLIDKFDKLAFVFEGEPRSKQSFRVAFRGGKAIKFQSKEVVNYENYIKVSAISQIPRSFKPFAKGDALRMQVEYIFPIPASYSKKKRALVESGATTFYKSTKPDLDSNLNKAICDALQGIVFENDSQIAVLTAVKRYGTIPSTRLVISKINEGDV